MEGDGGDGSGSSGGAAYCNGGPAFALPAPGEPGGSVRALCVYSGGLHPGLPVRTTQHNRTTRFPAQPHFAASLRRRAPEAASHELRTSCRCARRWALRSLTARFVLTVSFGRASVVRRRLSGAR